MHEEKIYWVWLSLIFPTSSDKPNRIIMEHGSPKDFFMLDSEEMQKLCYLTQLDVKLIKSVGLERATLIIESCEAKGIDIVTYVDPLFPQRLKLIYGPPLVLYVMGDISGLNEDVVITIVGTRKSSDYSSYATEYLSYQLAKAGAVVVSGCAVGIDSAAHRGALRAKAKTIAVMGCGLDINYPAENCDLKLEIIKHGALISELPPGTLVTGSAFPIRNRIMAGLCLGVLVTHAPERSGSLITVEHAIEQGKDIFCLPPYSIFDKQYFGVIKYLRDGAIPVFNAKDILIEYYGAYSHKLDVDKIIGNYINQKNKQDKASRVKSQQKAEPVVPEEVDIDTVHERQKQQAAEFDDEQKAVYDSLAILPRFIDEISVESGLDVGIVLSILTELEIYGIANSYSGRRFGLNTRE